MTFGPEVGSQSSLGKSVSTYPCQRRFLFSACGYTYGCNSIWQMFLLGEDRQVLGGVSVAGYAEKRWPED